MKKACAKATVSHEMEIRFDSTGGDHQKTPQVDVDAWIASIKKSLN